MSQANQLVLDNNPFAPIPKEKLGPQLDPIKYEEEIVERVLVPYAVAVDGNEENTVLRYKVVEKNRFNLNEYIASFADDVGIQNILRKVALSGDKSLLNQTKREDLCPNGGLEPVQDFTGVPKNKTEAFNAVTQGVYAFDSLPADLKGKMSLAQFVESFGQEEFDNYIAGIIAKQTKKEEVKE